MSSHPRDLFSAAAVAPVPLVSLIYDVEFTPACGTLSCGTEDDDLNSVASDALTVILSLDTLESTADERYNPAEPTTAPLHPEPVTFEIDNATKMLGVQGRAALTSPHATPAGTWTLFQGKTSVAVDVPYEIASEWTLGYRKRVNLP